jgi:antitoxin MazE
VIDRPILDLLKIDPETPLDLSTDGKRLERRKRFDAAQEQANRQHGRAFKKLAE